MGCFKMNKERGISERVAKQIRVGLVLGEVAYNRKVKGDLRGARSIMWKASKGPKATYMGALHTLASRLRKGAPRDNENEFTEVLDTGEVLVL